MTKQDLAKVLSLSCVENYFLAHFKDMFDVRMLYVASFIPFQQVMEEFLVHGASYENYGLARVQETSEELGLTCHERSGALALWENSLNLLRMNELFFENAKLMPWRADHYIAADVAEQGVRFWNNYPLSDGTLTSERVREVYGGTTLHYRLTDCFDDARYERLANRQFHSVIHSDVKVELIDESNTTALRNAVLVLRTIRKRLMDWLKFEALRKAFLFDAEFETYSRELLRAYDGIFTALELQIARKKTDVTVLQAKLDALAEQEGRLAKLVKLRRVINENIG